MHFLEEKLAHLVIRLGLAFAFLYPPYSAWQDPFAWIGYFPSFIRDFVGNDTLLLHGFGAIEIVIALWILSGWKIRLPALGAAVMLLGIIIFNWGQFDVLFRDVAILAMALALVLKPEERVHSPGVTVHAPPNIPTH